MDTAVRLLSNQSLLHEQFGFGFEIILTTQDIPGEMSKSKHAGKQMIICKVDGSSTE
jgi:hypothetical protein